MISVLNTKTQMSLQNNQKFTRKNENTAKVGAPQ